MAFPMAMISISVISPTISKFIDDNYNIIAVFG
jgi:hypothetical protein